MDALAERCKQALGFTDSQVSPCTSPLHLPLLKGARLARNRFFMQNVQRFYMGISNINPDKGFSELAGCMIRWLTS